MRARAASQSSTVAAGGRYSSGSMHSSWSARAGAAGAAAGGVLVAAAGPGLAAAAPEGLAAGAEDGGSR